MEYRIDSSSSSAEGPPPLKARPSVAEEREARKPPESGLPAVPPEEARTESSPAEKTKRSPAETFSGSPEEPAAQPDSGTVWRLPGDFSGLEDPPNAPLSVGEGLLTHVRQATRELVERVFGVREPVAPESDEAEPTVSPEAADRVVHFPGVAFDATAFGQASALRERVAETYARYGESPRERDDKTRFEAYDDAPFGELGKSRSITVEEELRRVLHA